MYFEDLEDKEVKEVAQVQDVNKDGKENIGSQTITVSSVKVAKAVSTPVTGKRQRTLMEMVGDSAKPKEPDSKKAKLGRTSSLASASGDQGPAKAPTLGLQPLNSIPFSMQAFKDSLTEEQKGFLTLECECMGKSW